MKTLQSIFMNQLMFIVFIHINVIRLSFLGLSWWSSGPVVRTSPSNARGAGSIPGQGAKIPHASWPESQNRSSIVTNSIKTIKF